MNWPPAKQALEGRIVRLEPIEPAHERGLEAAAADDRIWTWLDQTLPGSDQGFGRWFAERQERSGAGEEWCFVTVSAGSGNPIGSSSYLNVRQAHDGLEIGWTWLHPDAWRTGANVEAKLLMLTMAFDDLECQRVEFKTDSRNQRSRDALEALGASFEGIRRQHMNLPQGGVRDSAYFSILDSEWPVVKERLDNRLRAGVSS